MKQTMTFAILALVAIIIMSSFNINLSSTPVVSVAADVAGTELYVCPAASMTWDSIATAIHPFIRPIMIMFFFAVMMLLTVWGWAMYQNLLKDKFDRKSFATPWAFTKLTFWAGVIILLMVMTPNYFRSVTVTGDNRAWVLCENNSPGAVAVRADAVNP